MRNARREGNKCWNIVCFPQLHFVKDLPVLAAVCFRRDRAKWCREKHDQQSNQQREPWWPDGRRRFKVVLFRHIILAPEHHGDDESVHTCATANPDVTCDYEPMAGPSSVNRSF